MVIANDDGNYDLEIGVVYNVPAAAAVPMATRAAATAAPLPLPK